MPEVLARPTSLDLQPQNSLKYYEVVTLPDLGGEYQGKFNIHDTIVFAQPKSRNSAIVEAPKREFKPIELTPGLVIDRDLKKAGWDSEGEMKRFIDDINVYQSEGLTLQEAVSRSAEVFEKHIRYYNAEFIEQQPVLPHSNRLGLWNGETRLLGNNGRPVVDAVDSQERLGAVKRVSGKTEKDLIKAEDNSFVVLMSSQGESGYMDENGCDIPHLNTLTMVFWKDERGDMKGVTLITDLRIDQAEKVMEDLGSPPNSIAQKGTEMQRVVNILENPAKPSLPQTYKNPFEYVFDKIVAVRGEGDVRLRQKNGKVEIKPVALIRQKIDNFQRILDLNLTKERAMEGFIKFVTDCFQRAGDPDFQQSIVELAEETVLFFGGDYYLSKKNSPSITCPMVFPQYTESAGRITVQRSPEDGFRREVIAFMQSRGGCPSAVRALMGSSSGSAISSESTVSFSVGIGKKGKKCMSCGEVNYCTKECYKCSGMLI